jgi:beta-xylosidase
VVTAPSPAGPWSAPVDLKLQGFIDPGHVVDADGNRYLYLSGGVTVRLAKDGLSALDAGATAGLCLFYNEQANVRISADTARFTVFNQQNAKIRMKNQIGKHGFLRILNDENEISFYFSANGKEWSRLERSIDATGFNHNVFGGFMSLRSGLFAFGEGAVRFDNFVYLKR